MTSLLDVNVLIALVDVDHVHHKVSQLWFQSNHHFGWATCPLTENGMVRVLSHPSYASGQRTPAEVLAILSALRGAFHASHQFWPDDITLTDATLFKPVLLAGSRQVTDAYLLGLTVKHNGHLVSFDTGLPWRTIHGASNRTVQNPQGM